MRMRVFLQPRPAALPTPSPAAVWSPSHATFRGADREMGAKLVFKAHEAAVLGMTLFSSYGEGGGPPSLKLATTGAAWPGRALWWRFYVRSLECVVGRLGGVVSNT